jgi:hypothetical protein
MVKKCIESINNTAKTHQKRNTLHLRIAYLSGFKKRGVGAAQQLGLFIGAL